MSKIQPKLLSIILLILAFIQIATAQATVFTYQGRLSDAATAANGVYDLQFKLYNAFGNPVGAAQVKEDVSVSNGVFTVQLDFGAAAFDGSERVLEISVRRGEETGSFTPLSPRQPITSAPYAIRSLNAVTAENAANANSADNATTATTALNAQQLGGVGAANYLQTNGSGANLSNLNASSISSGTLNDTRLSANVALRNTGNTFTGNQLFIGNLAQTGTMTDLNLTNGFVARGTLETGAIPTSGAGVRMMFYPGKAAFRAGRVSADQWDDTNIGLLSFAVGNNVKATNQAAFAAGEGTTASGANSTALGYSTTANGENSTAIGIGTTASGKGSTAMGFFTLASGDRSIAMGDSTTASGTTSIAMGGFARASGTNSTAMGFNTTASGSYSIALGSFTTASGFNSTVLGSNASTNEKEGSFVYGDRSTLTPINATINNQFVVRAQNIWLGQNNLVTNTAGRFLETSTGAYLSTSGVWTNNSSRNLKTNFSMVDSRQVLRKVLNLPIQTWSYKVDSPNIRHIGVMAQDFYKAFNVGSDDEHITAVDTAGVTMAAIQGLNEEMTETTAKLRAENERLRVQVTTQNKQLAAQQAQMSEFEARLKRLEQASVKLSGKNVKKRNQAKR